MAQDILLMSDDLEAVAMVETALAGNEFVIDNYPVSIDALTRLAVKRRPDIIIIVMKRSSVGIMEAIRGIMQSQPVTIAMFVEEGNERHAIAATQAGVSAYVIDGLREDRVKPILTAAITRFGETQKLRQKLNKTEKDLEDRKLVERAKGLLMKQQGCSEDEAYSALRTLSMKQNKRMGEIAESVINAASLMG